MPAQNPRRRLLTGRGPPAALVIAGYALAVLLAGASLLRRRDITT
jgi:hypothetical protein